MPFIHSLRDQTPPRHVTAGTNNFILPNHGTMNSWTHVSSWTFAVSPPLFFATTGCSYSLCGQNAEASLSRDRTNKALGPGPWSPAPLDFLGDPRAGWTRVGTLWYPALVHPLQTAANAGPVSRHESKWIPMVPRITMVPRKYRCTSNCIRLVDSLRVFWCSLGLT